MDDLQARNQALITEFRAARERGEEPMPGRPLLILTTTGAKSGRDHTTPMLYVPDGDRLLVIASNIGAPKHPDWYINLVHNPRVTVEVGRDAFTTNAEVLTGEERQRWWETISAAYPFFVEHQAKTTRLIPLVALPRQASVDPR
jgi:deazaflavin-dependent oxidoreductase (nitroreductase family)